MNPWLIVILALFGLAVLWIVRQTRKAGPRELSARDLQLSSPLVRVTADEPGAGWEELGRRTRANGLHLRFDHDDDPAARATLLVPSAARAARGTLANSRTIRLGSEFDAHHVHTAGYAFRVRLRGTGAVIGREIRIQMVVDNAGRPYGGRIENDDDTDAAVGDWIEVEWAEVLKAPSG